MAAAAQQAIFSSAAPVQEEPRGLKRTGLDADGSKGAAAPDAKRQRLAQWIYETPRALKGALSRARGQLASSAAAIGERPLLQRPLLPRERLQRAAAAGAGLRGSALGGLRAAAASAASAVSAAAAPPLGASLARLGAGLRGWAVKDAPGLALAAGDAKGLAEAEPAAVEMEAPAEVPSPQVAEEEQPTASLPAQQAEQPSEAQPEAVAGAPEQPAAADALGREERTGEARPEAAVSDAAPEAEQPSEAHPEAVAGAPEQPAAADALGRQERTGEAPEAEQPSEALPADAAADCYGAAGVPVAGEAAAAPPAPTCVAALHPFDGAALHGEGYLELLAGDQIVCMSGEVAGWAYGQLVEPAGRAQACGWFPAAYVTPPIAAHC